MKVNRIIIIVGVVLMTVEALFLRMDWVHTTIRHFIDKTFLDRKFVFMHEKACDVSALHVLEDDTTAWYSRYRLIAHGGGGINGMCYTNTREAWETSYKRGVRVIDADLRFTTDGVLVLRHSWNDNIGQDDQTPMMKSSRILDSNGTLYNTIQGIPNNLATFKSTKVYRKLTPMTYLDMLAYLHSHRDLYVSCDIKGENNLKPDYKAVYTYMVNIARKSGYEDVLQNLIIRCYEYEDLDVILSIYPFKNITMYQQTRNPKNWYELCRFCIERGIHAINIPICYIDDPLVQLFVEKGIHVYVAVVDYLSDVEYLSKKGVSGFVTNYLSEQEVKQYCYK